MKSRIFVCILVVLACHIVMCFGTRSGYPLLMGGSNCQLDDIPEEFRYECAAVHCNKDANGEIRTFVIECGLKDWVCDDGRLPPENATFVSDTTKTYPSCCAKIVCD